MNEFKDFGIKTTSKSFVGDKIKMSKILNKKIAVIDFKMSDSKYTDKVNASVSMLGSNGKLQWKQDDDALVITKPTKLPDWKVSGYKIVFKN